MKSGIYKITNEVTGKFYIGSAKDIDKRWYDHKRLLTLNIHTSPKLQHSWNFYGKNTFSFLLLEEVEPDQSKLFEREQYYLDTFKPYIRGIGYNICPIASGGDTITNNPNREEFIEKMKLVTLGENNGMFGRTHSDGAIQKQKDKAKGRYTLDWFIERYGQIDGQLKYDARRLMLANRKMNYSNPNPLKGTIRGPMSDETKKKAIDVKRRMKECRPLIMEDIKSGKYSILQLCEKYNIGLTAVKYYKRKIKVNGG